MSVNNKHPHFFKHILIILIGIFIIACAPYPDPPSTPGMLSANSSEKPYQTWHEEFSKDIYDLIRIPEKDFLSARHYSEDYTTVSTELSSYLIYPIEQLIGEQQVLKDYKNFNKNECDFKSNQILDIDEIYIKKIEIESEAYGFSTQYYELYSCANQNTPVKFYFIRMPAYKGIFSEYIAENQPISYQQSFILLVPDINMIPTVNDQKVSPSFIYIRGHNTNHFKAAFDDDSYTKGIGFKMALQGFTVAIPIVRSFDESIFGVVYRNNEYEFNHRFETHEDYASFIFNEFGRSVVANATIDMVYIQSYLESPYFEQAVGYKISKTQNSIAGVSFGGQVAHLTGALDQRFEFVSTHGAYYGYEVINSSAHHLCQHMPAMTGLANIFDISLLIYPRTLHIAMGENDQFTNNSFFTALDEIIQSHEKLGSTICTTFQSTHMQNYPKFEKTPSCQLIFEIAPEVEHEFIINSLFIPE